MNIKNQLYDELEYELRESLSELMKTLGKYAGKTGAPVSLSKREAASLTLLTCYIKRRSNLFFRRKQAKDISREEFSIYLDELGGLAGTGGVNCLPFSNAGKTIPIREATLFYESYYRFLANVTNDLTLTFPGTRGRIAEEETAAAKLKVHDLLGEKLTLLTRITENGAKDIDFSALYESFGELFTELKNPGNQPTAEDRLRHLSDMFHQIGIEIRSDGIFPKSPRINAIFAEILRESVSNAARHGKATEILIHCEKNENGYALTIQDNGVSVSAPLTEGDGLRGARHLLQRNGGTFSYCGKPFFTIRAFMPEEVRT